jgi:hypothetical protein
MVNKNPYEVRLDVLKMAQEMLEAEQRINELKLVQKVAVLRELKSDSDTIISTIDSNELKPYSEQDVTSRASALYSFVTTK